MEDLVACMADELDAMLLGIQRMFCSHKPMNITDYAVLCEKCGKKLGTAKGVGE